MSLIVLTIRHGRTLEDARTQLEQTVREATAKFGILLSRTEWSADRSTVKLYGPGVEVEMRVDAEVVHVSGDMPILGRLLGDKVSTGLRAILQTTFRQLPGKSGPASA